MKLIEEKIRKAIETNKLNPKILGERNWCQYFICVTELVWSRNLHDGYKVEVYEKQSREHLATLTI